MVEEITEYLFSKDVYCFEIYSLGSNFLVVTEESINISDFKKSSNVIFVTYVGNKSKLNLLFAMKKPKGF